MKKRRLLRLEGDEIAVAREALFESEAALHRAIAAHPEVLPNEDLGIGPLVALANEFDTDAGPIDLLAASPVGELVIIEFKRGTENPDVRRVVAQVLDYGSALWRLSYEEFEERCASCDPMAGGSIEDHMTSMLSGPDVPEFDPVAFRREVENTLERGDFLFLYVGRDLDDRTRRIMTYLAEGPRIRFFAIEVSYFQSGDGMSVMVPRTAFVPSWVSGPALSAPAGGFARPKRGAAVSSGKGVCYLDSELYVASERHARFSWEGREYDDRGLSLGVDFRERLLEMELDCDAEASGRELFQAVFPAGSKLRDGLREALAKSEGAHRRLRLRLHFAPGLPDAHELSWELLFDPDRNVALGRSPDTAFSRYSTASVGPGSPAPGRPRLLGLVAAPVNAERYQMAPIDRTESHELGTRMDFDLLQPPATPGRLRDRLVGGAYQALHVFGHGLVRRGRRSALVLEDEAGAARFVDEELLAEIFLGDRDLRLVTLIACHGGALSLNEAFSGLAGRLVERGVPAVIGMCRAVTFDTGHLFSDHLYRNLARTGRVDVAVNEARQQLYLDDPGGVAWSSPVLYMRLADGLLWPLDE